MASVASDMGWLWTGWIGPALVQMSGMLSVRRDVVIVCELLQGLVVFFIDLLFLREQSPWSFSGLDSCVFAYCSSAAPLLSLQSFYNYARGHCETAQGLNCSGVCWEEGMWGGGVDWCCFYYFVRNSLVALLEALCARIPFFRFVNIGVSWRFAPFFLLKEEIPKPGTEFDKVWCLAFPWNLRRLPTGF